MCRRIIVCISMLCLLLARAGAQEGKVDIVKARFDAMNRHDVKALGMLFADGARAESPNWQGAIVGRKNIEESYARYFTSTPDLRYSITRVIEGDSSVVVEYTSSGTFQNPERGMPEFMRGKTYTLKNCTRMDIRNGKIVAECTYFDQVSFLRQTGFFQNRGQKQQNSRQ